MPFDTEDVGLSIAPSPPAAMQAHDFTESQEKSMSLEGFSIAEVAYLSMCLSLYLKYVGLAVYLPACLY